MEMTPLLQSDIANLRPLIQEHMDYERHIGEAPCIGELESYFASDAVHAWVIREKGIIEGYVVLNWAYDTWTASSYLHLDCLFLRDHCRSKGWGTWIMDQLAKFAREKNSAQIQWQTPMWNQNAIRFYQRKTKPLQKARFIWKV